MEIKERKERIHQLQADISKSTSPEVMWLRELLELLYEDAKDRLVDASGDDIPRIQGEARSMEKFFRQISAASALLRAQREQ